MPVGRPDWYSVGQSNNIASLDDMGELAVRLGSGVNYDRTGKVIWYDPFSRLDSSYTIVNSGAPTPLALQTDFAETAGSGLSAELYFGGSNHISISKTFRSWNKALLSLECAFSCDHLPYNVIIELEQRQDSVNYIGRYRYIGTSNSLEVYNSSGVYERIGLLTGNNIWPSYYSVMKLDVDTTKWNYVRCRFNERIFDLPDYGMYRIGSSTPNQLIATLSIYSNPLLDLKLWVDRFIITEDE